MDPDDSSVTAVQGQSLMEVPCPVDQTPQNCNFYTDDSWRLRLIGVCVCVCAGVCVCVWGGAISFLGEQMAPRLGLMRSISGPFTGPAGMVIKIYKNTYTNAMVATGCQYCRYPKRLPLTRLSQILPGQNRQLWPRDALGPLGPCQTVRAPWCPDNVWHGRLGKAERPPFWSRLFRIPSQLLIKGHSKQRCSEHENNIMLAVN